MKDNQEVTSVNLQAGIADIDTHSRFQITSKLFAQKKLRSVKEFCKGVVLDGCWSRKHGVECAHHKNALLNSDGTQNREPRW